MIRGGKLRGHLCCSFCGKSDIEVKKIVVGPAVYICNECADIVYDIIHPERLRRRFKRTDAKASRRP